jgi:hypothetical protein
MQMITKFKGKKMIVSLGICTALAYLAIQNSSQATSLLGGQQRRLPENTRCLGKNPVETSMLSLNVSGVTDSAKIKLILYRTISQNMRLVESGILEYDGSYKLCGLKNDIILIEVITAASRLKSIQSNLYRLSEPNKTIGVKWTPDKLDPVIQW